ncbi:MAG: adenine phosphoribosyltransferase [Spirochaetales bacterium]
MKRIEDYIVSIPDFPAPGIIFRDVTGILQDAEGLRLGVDEMTQLVKDLKADVVAGLEARGFIFGMPIAYNLGVPFVPVRKKGKLPRATVEKTYNLEYGTATIEIHKDAIKKGQRVVLVDDLVATGGTLKAGAELVEQLGGKVVGIVTLIELEGLKGREFLKGYELKSIVKYPGA